jgi:subtilisin family serine protease
MKKVLTSLILASFLLTVPLQQARAQGRTQPASPQTSPPKLRKVLKPVAGRYIVVLKDDVPGAEVPAVAASLARAHGGRLRHTFRYAPKGFSVALPEPAAEALSRDPRVEFVEEVAEVEVTGVESTPFEASVFWGLDRIDQSDGLDQLYHYNRVGNAVHAYVIDCGIWLPHVDFEGRANAVYDYFGEDGQGDDQHGTFVAGVLGSRRWGVAKNVRLHSVRVLDLSNADGATVVRGSSESIAAGINFVAGNHLNPAVANLSAGVRGGSASVDNAANALVNTYGVTLVTGAGNANENLNTVAYSPQRVASVITVAATDGNDNRASYSNYGSAVDLFAPGGQASLGQYIPVPAFGTADGREGFTGTSASAPHVAGVAAQYLEYDPAASPATVSGVITGNATPDRVGNIPERCVYNRSLDDYICTPTTVNLLLYSGFVPAPASNPIYTSTDLFVKQQYWDVQYRDPDANGYAGWTAVIDQCGADEACRQNARVDVGFGHMASTEASEYRSYWIYRYLRTAFGAMPTFYDFNRDVLSISRSADSAQFLAARDAYAAAFVDRAEFHSRYDGLSNAAYVDALAANAGATLPNRNQLVYDLDTGAKTRAEVLREIVESSQVFNSLYNEGWVARCYYLYLRRGPDAGGFNSWMSTLNSTGDYRGIIFGFIYSTEYQMRFQ